MCKQCKKQRKRKENERGNKGRKKKRSEIVGERRKVKRALGMCARSILVISGQFSKH